MEDIIIQPTEDSPEINFSSNTGVLKISGRAYSNDINNIFKKLNIWLDEYMANPKDTIISLQLDYANTVFNRLLFDFIKKCILITEKGKKVDVKWYFHKDDEDSIDSSSLLSKVINFPIENIEIE